MLDLEKLGYYLYMSSQEKKEKEEQEEVNVDSIDGLVGVMPSTNQNPFEEVGFSHNTRPLQLY